MVNEWQGSQSLEASSIESSDVIVTPTSDIKAKIDDILSRAIPWDTQNGYYRGGKFCEILKQCQRKVEIS
jgi:hypothetical protein